MKTGLDLPFPPQVGLVILILQVSMKLPMLGGEAPDVPSTVRTKTEAVTHSPENALPMFSEKRKSCMSSDRLSRSPFAFPFRFVGIEKVIVIVSRKLYTEFLSVGSSATSETMRGDGPKFPVKADGVRRCGVTAAGNAVGISDRCNCRRNAIDAKHSPLVRSRF